MVLRAHIGEYEAILHSLTAPLLVGGGAHMSAVITGAAVIVGGGAILHIRIGPEIVRAPHVTLGLIAEKLPSHPVGRAVLLVERKQESLVFLDLRRGAFGNLCHKYFRRRSRLQVVHLSVTACRVCIVSARQSGNNQRETYHRGGYN